MSTGGFLVIWAFISKILQSCRHSLTIMVSTKGLLNLHKIKLSYFFFLLPVECHAMVCLDNGEFSYGY